MSKSKDNKQKKECFKVFRIVKNTVLGVVIAFLTLVLIVSMISRFTGQAPSMFGYSLYRVSSGSMRPELQVGDIILVKQCDGNSVKADEIVSFIATSGEMQGHLVTHRVVKEPFDENGEKYVITKGDANAQNDQPEKVSQIKGKLITKIGILKYLFDFFVTPWGLLALIGLIILAFFNEIIIFVKSLFGIGYEPEPKESVQDIIERYQKENMKKDSSGESEETDSKE